MARSLFLQSVRAPRDWEDVKATTASIVRARIFEGMAKIVGERGYANATISDVVKAAGISRRTFYEHFQDKEDCFVATYQTGCENGISQIGAALANLENPDWRSRLWSSIDTYLSVLAAEPHFARVLLIEVLGAGERALAMRERILAIYVDHYRKLHTLAQEEDPELPDVPDEFLRALVGGIAELVQQCLLETSESDVSERLRALTPGLVSFASAVLTSGRASLEHPAESDGDARDLARSPVASG
jgi:AcrR family transcriptional regulator